MRTLFWSVIALVLLLSLTSLAFYGGEEEVVAEKPSEAVTQMVGELRAQVDLLTEDFGKLEELIALSIAAANSPYGQRWIVEAENLQVSLQNRVANSVSSLERRILSSNPPVGVAKQVQEFMGRAHDCLAIESHIAVTIAKHSVGLDVPQSEWMALADMYAGVKNTYQRNMGLKALSARLVAINPAASSEIAVRLDAPFVKMLYRIEQTTISADEILQSGLDDFLKLQLLVALGKHQSAQVVSRAAVQLVTACKDAKEQAFCAARVLTQLPGIPAAQRNALIALVEQGDALLVASTKIAIGDDAALENIPQQYPRERLLASSIKKSTQASLNSLIEAAEEITSVTLRDEVLLHIATNKSPLSDDDFALLIDSMEDSYVQLVAKLDRLKKAPMAPDAATKYLMSLEAFAESVKESQPLIDLTVAWGCVDPYMARQTLTRFDTPSRVQAAVALSAVLTEEAQVSRILADVREEVSRTTTFEPVEKSTLLRQIAGAVQAVDTDENLAILEEAYRAVVQ
jgi:hypothetical protein